MHWFLDPITKQYADFKGRATRTEYWMFTLVVPTVFWMLLMLAVAVAMTVSSTLGVYVSIIFMVLLLGMLVPLIAIQIRRLHDIGWSGWWCLLNFIPYIGGLILLVLCCIPSQKGTNKYGPNKYGVASDSVSPQSSETVAQPSIVPPAQVAE